MKRGMLCLIIAIFLLLSLGIPAVADTYKNGEVLYHQNFVGFHEKPLEMTGIRKGTASSPESYLWPINSALYIVTEDDLRTYTLLPEIPWTDSYTFEFTFRLEDVRSSRGYLAFLLTCWGDEPSNITSLVIRANGTIDDFSPLSAEMIEIIQEGKEMIHVQIPIENGVLHEVTLTAGNKTCTVERDSLKRITEGNRGFGVRNLTACIGEIYVVNGTGYTAKTGSYAEISWSDDPANTDLIEAPSTGDPMWLLTCPTVCAGIMIWAKRTKRNR